MTDLTRLDRAFTPRCIAVVGDKDRLRWLRAQSTFRGQLYSVQIDPSAIEAIEALGVRNYPSLLDIPDTVDLAIVAVPRGAARNILRDCIRKGVGAAHFFTSGFGEAGTEEGSQLEAELAAMARDAGFPLIGPNCMGIFNPALGIRQSEQQYVDSRGGVGLISQSGTHAARFSSEAHLQGVDIGKSVSFGNGTVLDSTDYLEYFGEDASIRAVGMYLEGVKDGRRFMSVLKQVTARKPVVIWKGGRTDEGHRAIASHTGSLAIAQVVWDAAIRQCGAVGVKNMEELIDTLQALLYFPPVRGNRVGVAGVSGGQSVAISDAFAEAGLSVPPLTQPSYDEFATFFRVVGGSYRNPVDAGMFNVGSMKRILQILEKDASIDNLAFLLFAVSRDVRLEETEDVRSLIEVKRESAKPFLVILPFSLPDSRAVAERLRDSGIPAFITLERAARALRNALDYYRLSQDRLSGAD